jgi:hypothetical protein
MMTAEVPMMTVEGLRFQRLFVHQSEESEIRLVIGSIQLVILIASLSCARGFGSTTRNKDRYTHPNPHAP